jgi:hypothetical protein
VRGYCRAECVRDQDCPCGSTCAPSCGICIRDDLRGPATCFPFANGLATTDVLGACRADVADGGSVPRVKSRSRVDAGQSADGGVCPPRVIDQPSCAESPPRRFDAGPPPPPNPPDAAPSDGGPPPTPTDGAPPPTPTDGAPPPTPTDGAPPPTSTDGAPPKGGDQ